MDIPATLADISGPWLEAALAKVPAAYHEAMRMKVRGNRELVEAWASQDSLAHHTSACYGPCQDR